MLAPNEQKPVMNGFYTGYLLFGAVCEQCENNALTAPRKRIKCLYDEKCALLLTRRSEITCQQ